MSAERLRDPGMSDGTSLLGARAANWAAEYNASLKELCHECDPHFHHNQPDGLAIIIIVYVAVL